jgi:integrase
MKEHGGLLPLAQQYVEYRRKLGFRLKVEGQQVLAFAEYADRSGHKGAISIDLALRWARLPEARSALYHARRLEIVRCFARYAALFDEATEIPARGLLGRAHERVQPHIYSDKEIAELMQAAVGITPAGGLRPQTYVTLFGLLASTGLRISEALGLRRDDVNIPRGVLTITETKFHKSRLVPFHPSTASRLEDYSSFRDRYHRNPASNAFLLSERGTDMAYSTVSHTFREVCDGLGWKGSPACRRPRLYDFRHTFACRRLLQWYRDDVNLDHAVAALSTYMGHVRITDTYWYITGIPELMQVAGERFEAFAHGKTQEKHQ